MARPILLIASVLATVAMNAAETRPVDNYRSIVDRNPFGLKPVPPPPEEKAKPADAPGPTTEFYLTGISTMGYPNVPKKAYLLNKDNSKKEYADKFYNLRINEKVGDVRLDDIDEKGRRVKITYQGNEMWLSMKDNGVPTPTSVAPPQGIPGVPGVPGAPGMMPGVRGTVPGQMQIPPGVGAVPLPGGGSTGNFAPPAVYPNTTSNRRIPRSSGVQNMMGGGYAPAPNYTPNYPNGAVPNPNYGNNPGQPNSGNYPASEPEVDPAIQYLKLKAAEKQAENSRIPFPPIPNL